MLAKIISDRLLKKLGRLESGQLDLTLPNGRQYVFEGKSTGSKASIALHSWQVLSNLMQKGDVGFAEDYRDGLWETNDLLALTHLGLSNQSAMNTMIAGNKMSRFIGMLSYLMNLNTLKGSRKNIQAHYDLGNDFYRLWLDPTMSYSAALYQNDDDSLQQAQLNKYDRLIAKLPQRSGRLLEVGCGWGGFAERAMQQGDYAIKGITLSDEQHAYAQNRLGQNAEIALEDYRLQDKQYDNIVSIEMFEAVGERYWKTYFSMLKQCLSRHGKALVQTITINEADFEQYRKGSDFIRSFIFPGGMLPSPSRFNQEAAQAGLKVNDQYFFAEGYAKTLEVWLENFDHKKAEVKQLGFDDRFIRLWRFYLAACAAGFRTRKTNVMQVELVHA